MTVTNRFMKMRKNCRNFMIPLMALLISAIFGTLAMAQYNTASAQANVVDIVIDPVTGNVGDDIDIVVRTTTDLGSLNPLLGNMSLIFEYDPSLLHIYGSDIQNTIYGSPNVNTSAGNAYFDNVKSYMRTAANGNGFTNPAGTLIVLKAKVVGSGSNPTGISVRHNTQAPTPGVTINSSTGSVTTGGNATDGLVMTFNNVAGVVGSTVQGSIDLSNILNYGGRSFQIELNYDATKFDLSGFSIGSGFSGATINTQNSPSAGKYLVQGDLGTPGTGAGQFLTFDVNLLDQVNNSPITFTVTGPTRSYIDAPGMPPVHYVNGTVTADIVYQTPTLTSLTPTGVVAGAGVTTVDVVGTNFVPGATTFSINGTTISAPNAYNVTSNTTATITFAAATLASPANLPIRAHNPTTGGGGGQSNALTFAVGTPAPSPTGINPTNFFWGETAQATISGTGFFTGATLDPITGFTFGGYNVQTNSMQVNVTVAPGTSTASVYMLKVKNSGSASVDVLDVSVRYRAPIFTSISPAVAQQGETVNVTVTGNYFYNAGGVKTALSLGTGFTVNSVTINSMTSLTANITVGASTAVGLYDVELSNAAGANASGGSVVGEEAFEVISSSTPTPVIEAITPDEGHRSSTMSVTILGTNFNASYTTVNFGTGISHGITSIHPTSIVAQITIAPNAALGARQVTVTNAGGGGSTTHTFTVLEAANTAPVVTNKAYSTPFNTTLTIPAPGLLAGATDDNPVNQLIASVVTPPNAAHGTVTVNGNGSFTFVPALNFQGQTSFTYRATDTDNAQSNVATVTITVHGQVDVNYPPIAYDDNYTTGFNTTLTVNAPGVIANDSDDNGTGNLTAELVTGIPSSVGSLTFNSNGSFVFVPANGYAGSTQFIYRVIDQGGLASNDAVVRITVAGVQNAAPTANDDLYTTNLETKLTVEAPGVLANDTDDSGFETLKTELVSSSNIYGTFQLFDNGSFTYEPPKGFTGISTFTYRAVDPQGLRSNIATVTIVVSLPAPTHTANWPAGGNPFVSITPRVEWNAVYGATYYEVDISKNANFQMDASATQCYPNCGAAKIASDEASLIRYSTHKDYVNVSKLKVNQRYYWRVRAKTATAESAWSEVRTFTTVAFPGTPNLTLPNHEANNVSMTPTFNWNAVDVATSYRVQIAAINRGANLSGDNIWAVTQVDQVVTNNFLTLTTPLTGGPIYAWRVQAVSAHGVSEWSAPRTFTRVAMVNIDDPNAETPIEFALNQNYPNPFNPSTVISYSLPETADVTLHVFTVQGQLVQTLVNNVRMGAGTHQVSFDASSLSSGVYIYQITAGNFRSMQKMTLIK